MLIILTIMDVRGGNSLTDILGFIGFCVISFVLPALIAGLTAILLNRFHEALQVITAVTVFLLLVQLTAFIIDAATRSDIAVWNLIGAGTGVGDCRIDR
ncbi:hypothetical protein GSY69_13725 [Brevibacterium sp. 5221]|uniref:Uncharacterized protein n=1 Tax=Brevibacterium rongguiense TaxID=2695267 RepID=A0A6N9HB13_9MICO|nr:hypothetical protein [Brevibacterium rongguiense]MYM20986.1 hypothetical protein [Brevibacterium rongguiense]